MLNPQEPHNSLPPLSKLPPLPHTELVAHALPAYRALERLHEALKYLPSPAILLNPIATVEGADSSGIEAIVTTGDRLFLHQAVPLARSDPATKEAARYPGALREAVASSAYLPLCFRTATLICSRLLATTMQMRRTPVALRNDRTGVLVYTPPNQPDILADLLQDWERFVHQVDDFDPLTRVAILHSQFVAIHPFTDGNGRTARILHTLLLGQYDLLREPVLYLSRFLLRDRAAYYAHLQAVQAQGDWVGFVKFMADITREAAKWTYDRIEVIRQMHAQTGQKLADAAPFLARQEVLDVLFAQPYCRTEHMQRAGCSKDTAGRYLRQIAALGILQPERIGREVVYRHGALVRALEG